jgi:hypothetical protein
VGDERVVLMDEFDYLFPKIFDNVFGLAFTLCFLRISY